MKIFTYLLCVVSFLISFTGAAQELNFKKGERAQKDITRDAQSRGAEIIELLELKQGMTVIDILGGGGYFSELAAAKIGRNGSVILHNNQAYMPWVEKELVARLANNRLVNVIRHDRETENLDLKKSSADAVIFALGYHDLYHQAKDWKVDKEDFLKQVNAALKTGGKFLIIDHSALDGTGIKSAQDLHRIDVNYVKKEMKSKGYKLIKQSDLLANKNDSRTITPFKPEIRRKTDRFILVFEKL